MSGTKVYDAPGMTIILGGYSITGFAEGSFLTVKMASDAFTKVVGTDGEVARTPSSDRSAEVTLKLIQTSDSNDVLSALHNADLLAPNGAGIVPIQIRDPSGRSIYTAPDAWVRKFPDSDFDKSAKSREWTIDVGHMSMNVGGN